MNQQTQAATLASGMSRLSRPPQLQQSPLMQQAQNPQAPAMPMYGPQHVPQQGQPAPMRTQPMYGGPMLAPQQQPSPFHGLVQNTRNPQTSNLAALFQRFLSNQGVS